jgi:hypothetical protein
MPDTSSKGNPVFLLLHSALPDRVLRRDLGYALLGKFGYSSTK